ncbi:MAG: hypothetical protein GX594_14645 [Pirellulaceae bacterium]|nr:hypothetical protein [Pirellulaceae bacterium]
MLALLAAACAAPRPAVGQTPELTQPVESRRFASFHRAGGENAAVPAAASRPANRPETARNSGGARLALNTAPSSPLKKGATAGLFSSEGGNPRKFTAGQASSGTQTPHNRLFQRAAKAAEPAPHPRGRAGTLEEGLAFMVIGMSVTLTFLIVMIFCMMGLHRLLEVYNRFFPEAPQSAPAAPSAEPTNDHVALAIAVAIAQSKKQK